MSRTIKGWYLHHGHEEPVLDAGGNPLPGDTIVDDNLKIWFTKHNHSATGGVDEVLFKWITGEANMDPALANVIGWYLEHSHMKYKRHVLIRPHPRAMWKGSRKLFWIDELVVGNKLYIRTYTKDHVSSYLRKVGSGSGLGAGTGPTQFYVDLRTKFAEIFAEHGFVVTPTNSIGNRVWFSESGGNIADEAWEHRGNITLDGLIKVWRWHGYNGGGEYMKINSRNIYDLSLP